MTCEHWVFGCRPCQRFCCLSMQHTSHWYTPAAGMDLHLHNTSVRNHYNTSANQACF